MVVVVDETAGDLVSTVMLKQDVVVLTGKGEMN